MAIKKTGLTTSLRGKKGSLMIEACITFPLFLCFFLFLIFFIRIACVHVTLDHAINEAAKELAANSYPVALFNSLEDELLAENINLTFPTYEEEIGQVGRTLKNRVESEDVLSKIFSGKLTKEDITGMMGEVAGNAAGNYAKGIKGYLTRTFAGKYFEMKTRAKYAAAEYLIKEHCRNSYVSMEDIQFVLVEIPQGDAEFQLRSQDKTSEAVYNEMEISRDAGNVIIAVDYSIKLAIPLIGEKSFRTRHISVEKAWIQGQNNIRSMGTQGSGEDGISTGGEEGGDEASASQMVYITRLGEKYHEDGCMYLARSKIPISLADAKARGYEPCKVCVLKTAKDWRK